MAKRTTPEFHDAAAAVEPETDRTVVIERVYDVPARVLFLAHSKPEHVRRWFGPPGYPLTLCEMDFRAGGRYRFAMTGPDGVQMTPFGGTYIEIIEDRLISYTDAFEGADAEAMTVTVTFHEEDGRTRLVHRTVFASVAMKQQHLAQGYEQGLGAAVDQLAAVVGELARA
jgi:uncharacterized protein YndB with AHSA1/START domain